MFVEFEICQRETEGQNMTRKPHCTEKFKNRNRVRVLNNPAVISSIYGKKVIVIRHQYITDILQSAPQSQFFSLQNPFR